MQNHFRFRIGPEMTIAIGATVMSTGDEMFGQQAKMIASRHPRADEMEAYERLLTDATAGDQTRLLVKTTSRRRGELLILRSEPQHRCTNINQKLGDRRKFNKLTERRARERCRTRGRARELCRFPSWCLGL